MVLEKCTLLEQEENTADEQNSVSENNTNYDKSQHFGSQNENESADTKNKDRSACIMEHVRRSLFVDAIANSKN